MNDDELYELAKERIANDNGKRYSQDEIMEEFEIDEDDDFYEEKPFDWISKKHMTSFLKE